MKDFRNIITSLLLLCALFIQAKDYKVNEIPLVHLQDRTQYVSNPDQLLNAESILSINQTLAVLEEQTGIQVLVAVVSGIEGGDCFDFAMKLGERAGVGQKERDNGLIILLSTEERCVQFVTGYGIEGTLTDALCKRIQSKYMLPYFKDDNWNQGMVEGIQAIAQMLDGSMENVDDEDEEELIAVLIFIFLFLGIIGIIIYLANRPPKCTQCGKRHTKLTSTKVLEDTRNYTRVRQTYQCEDCGHIFTILKRIDKVNSTDGSRGGGIHGGYGGRTMGGGFGGGSYGGGRFGGGGAGSRF